MRIPPDIIKNTEALLALLSAALSAGGMLLAIVLCASLLMSLRSLDNAVSPQFDSAFSAISDARQTLSSAADASAYASHGLANVSYAISQYSDSSKNISDSLSSIAAVPPFSLDSRLSSAAKGFRQASTQFYNASLLSAAASRSVSNTSSSLRQAHEDLGLMAHSLDTAKREFKNSIFMLQVVAVAAALSLLALFSSVMMVSVSILLSHYPRLFERGGNSEQKHERAQGGESGKREEKEHILPGEHSAPGQAYRPWQPGQSRYPREPGQY